MGGADKLATAEVERIPQDYTEAQLQSVFMESRMDRMHALLYIHLPDKTLVYDHAASLDIGTPIWTVQTSGANGDQAYRARGFVRAYDQVAVRRQPELAHRLPQHRRRAAVRRKRVPWQFDTLFAYNEGRGAIAFAFELVRPARPGDARTSLPPATVETSIAVSWSDDGITYCSRASAARLPGERKWPGRPAPARPDVALPQLPIPGMNNPYPDAFARRSRVRTAGA